VHQILIFSSKRSTVVKHLRKLRSYSIHDYSHLPDHAPADRLRRVGRLQRRLQSKPNTQTDGRIHVATWCLHICLLHVDSYWFYFNSDFPRPKKFLCFRFHYGEKVRTDGRGWNSFFILFFFHDMSCQSSTKSHNRTDT